MRFLAAMVCISLLALESCKKKAENVLTINEESIEHFSFKKGSHWIYKDSLTKSIDSVYLNSIEDSIRTVKGGPSYQRKRMKVLCFGQDTLFTDIVLESGGVIFYFPLYSETILFGTTDTRNRVQEIRANNIVYSNAIKIVKANLEAYFVDDIGLVKLYVKSDSMIVRKCLELDRCSVFH